MRNERIEQLPGQFRAIRNWLEAHISGIPDVILAPSEVTALASLKPVSDMLDGLICTWIGIEHLSERTVGLGMRSPQYGNQKRPTTREALQNKKPLERK